MWTLKNSKIDVLPFVCKKTSIKIPFSLHWYIRCKEISIICRLIHKQLVYIIKKCEKIMEIPDFFKKAIFFQSEFFLKILATKRDLRPIFLITKINAGDPPAWTVFYGI